MKECFLIGAYCNTEQKLNELKNCLINLKKYNLPILISSHYSLPENIIKDLDGFIYDSQNDILYQKDFEQYKSGFWYFYENDNLRIDKAFDFHHDYAFWTQLRNGFSLAKNKGFDMVYYLDFDVELDDETFQEIKLGSIGYDSCFYPLLNHMYLLVFSCNPTLGLKVTEKYPTFYDYFYDKAGKTNCEKVFYDELINLKAMIKSIPKILTNKTNFQDFSSILNYDSNNFYIKNKKVVAGIFVCCDDDDYLFLWMNIKDNSHNFKFYVEYDGYFMNIITTLTRIGKNKDNNTIKVYADGNLFYTKEIENASIFKKYNRIQLK